MKIKNRSRKRSHKRDGIGVRRIRTFPFLLTLLTTPSLTFRLRSCENQIVGVGSRSGSSLRGRQLKGKGKGVLGARETRGAREEGGRETPFPSSLLPHAWSRALIPFPSPFERLPRRLKRKDKPRTMHVPTLCDWFGSSASAFYSDNLVFTRL